MSYVVTAYFTVGTPYEEHVKRLIRSMQRFNICYDVKPIQPKGDWYANTQWKPYFVEEMLAKHFPKSVVYVDADAEFMRYPSLFDEYDERDDACVAAHVLDHTRRRRKHVAPELLSGTLYFKNCATTYEIVEKWKEECKVDSKLWDQVALDRALKNYPFFILPEEYCTIFDYMSDVEEPVIKHYQASRAVKNAPPPPKDIDKPEPRVVSTGAVKRHPATAVRRGGLTRIGRKHRH